MVGQLLSLHVGQCGSQIGQAQWELLSQEHAIDREGYSESVSPGIESMFYQSISGKLTPRCVFYDLEPDILDKV